MMIGIGSRVIDCLLKGPDGKYKPSYSKENVIFELNKVLSGK